MGRLAGKNILVVIPKDYYNENELDPLMERFQNEEPEYLKLASCKFKEAVGMKTGRVFPDLLIVDAVEGIVGDSYVTAGKGTRQIKGIFHGIVILGGTGARKYLWPDRILKLMLTDRYRSGFVVAAIGLGVPCLGKAGLLECQDVAAEINKHSLKELEEAKATITEEDVIVGDRIITARDSSAVDKFAEAVIEAVAQTKNK